MTLDCENRCTRGVTKQIQFRFSTDDGLNDQMDIQMDCHRDQMDIQMGRGEDEIDSSQPTLTPLSNVKIEPKRRSNRLLLMFSFPQ